jgi:hypothetical protein
MLELVQHFVYKQHRYLVHAVTAPSFVHVTRAPTAPLIFKFLLCVFSVVVKSQYLYSVVFCNSESLWNKYSMAKYDLDTATVLL